MRQHQSGQNLSGQEETGQERSDGENSGRDALGRAERGAPLIGSGFAGDMNAGGAPLERAPRRASLIERWRRRAKRRALVAARRAGGALASSELRLKPLGPDYWPGRTRTPFLRIILALLVAPLPAMAAILSFGLALYWWDEGQLGPALAMTGATAADLAPLFAALAAGGAAPAFALLWSFRLRRRTAFVAAGAVIGLVAAAVMDVIEPPITTTAGVFLIASGVVTMLCLRSFAGVRKQRRAEDGA